MALSLKTAYHYKTHVSRNEPINPNRTLSILRIFPNRSSNVYAAIPEPVYAQKIFTPYTIKTYSHTAHVRRSKLFADLLDKASGIRFELGRETDKHFHRYHLSGEQRTKLLAIKNDLMRKLRDALEESKTDHCELDKDQFKAENERKIILFNDTVAVDASNTLKDSVQFEDNIDCMSHCERKKKAQIIAQRITENDEDVEFLNKAINIFDLKISNNDSDKLKASRKKTNKSAQILLTLSKRYDLGIDNYLRKFFKTGYSIARVQDNRKAETNKKTDIKDARLQIFNDFKILIQIIEYLRRIEAEQFKRAIINFIRRKKDEEKILEAYYEKMTIKKNEELKRLNKIRDQKHINAIKYIFAGLINR